MNSGNTPNPANINSLDQLAKALTALRRLRARPGQVQLSVRDVAALIKRPVSTLDAYLRGVRLIPSDIYEKLLAELGVAERQMPLWLDAWDRLADQSKPRDGSPPPQARFSRSSEVTTSLFRVVGPRRRGRLGVVAGDIRQVRHADVWVNSENTEMRMARFEDDSISAIVRYGGAVRDKFGRVTNDVIADELEAQVAEERPVAAGVAIATGPGELCGSNRVRHVIHVASVRGEPGEGYRPAVDAGQCVANVLRVAETLDPPAASVLFPLLGTGEAGADRAMVTHAMIAAALHYLTARPNASPHLVYLLASTVNESDTCLAAMMSHPRLVPLDAGQSRHPASATLRRATTQR